MKKILKWIGYGILLVLVLFQIIGILFSPSLKESLIRLFVVFCVAIFFAIKWQKKHKKTETTDEMN